MKQEKGFTLIELLAVIVILAVIALIATPLIMGTITKAKMNSFKDSMYGVLKTAENYTAELLLENNNTYKGEKITLPETGTDKKLNYKGQDNIKGIVVIDLFGNISMKAKNASKCFYKNSNEKEIKEYEGNCDKLENYQGVWKVPTDEKYFKTVPGENGMIIIDYDIAGGKDVVIPYSVNGKTVTRIGRVANNVSSDQPFYNKGITSVFIPDTVYLIDTGAFANNLLKEVTLPASLNSLWSQVFYKNQLEKVEFRGNVPEVISHSIFESNPNLLKPNTIKVPKSLLYSYQTVKSKYGDDAKTTWFGKLATEDTIDAFYE